MAMLFSLVARAEQLTIAVASNFAAPMQQIARQFEERSGHQVKLAFGSTGKIFAQIYHGAPFQGFFSADQAKPAQLVELGLAEAGSRFTYAEGKLALWSSKSKFVDSNGEVLAHGSYNRLAIANPKLAPYGAAAVEVLQQLGLEESTRPRWVQGENISQTYQFVASGNADLGLVAVSQLLQDGSTTKGSVWVVPEHLYSPIRQDAVILQRGLDSSAMNEFWEFVQSAEARAIIRAYGYRTAQKIDNNINAE